MGSGNNVHPSPVQFVNRIRKYCASKIANLVVNNANVEYSDEVVKVLLFSFLLNTRKKGKYF